MRRSRVSSTNLSHFFKSNSKDLTEYVKFRCLGKNNNQTQRILASEQGLLVGIRNAYNQLG